MLLRRCGFALTIALAAIAARADLVITVGDATIPAGTVGPVYIPVTITGASDLLQLDQMEFRITRTSGTGAIAFTTPEPAAGVDPVLSNGAYVFAGDSGDLLTPSAPAGHVSTVSTSNDTYIVGDSTASGNDVTVTSSKFLIDLPVTTSDINLAAGSTFSIALQNSANTFFFDSSFDPIGFSTGMPPGGTITISDAIATPLPKPLTALIVMLGILGMVVCLQRRSARLALVKTTAGAD